MAPGEPGVAVADCFEFRLVGGHTSRLAVGDDDLLAEVFAAAATFLLGAAVVFSEWKVSALGGFLAMEGAPLFHVAVDA